MEEGPPLPRLTLGSAVLALIAGIPLADTFTSFSKGLGSTVGSVGTLIAFGAIIGKLLIDSGGADRIVDAILDKTPAARLPWAMAFIAFVIGIPLFFEVGVVLLIAVVMLVARKANLPLVLVGIPALAGLSALHGLVPPHPGPLIAIDALGADLGITLGLGLLVAIPTVIISGPLIAPMMARWVPIEAKAPLGEASDEQSLKRPSFGISIFVVLLPVILMLGRTLVETLMGSQSDSWVYQGADFLGQPIVALLITFLVAIVLFGVIPRRSADEISSIVGASLGPIAGILLIVGAAAASSRPSSIQASQRSSPPGLSRQPCPPSSPDGLSPSPFASQPVRPRSRQSPQQALWRPSPGRCRLSRPPSWSLPSGRAQYSSPTSTTPDSGW